jgi:hypothetical protein
MNFQTAICIVVEGGAATSPKIISMRVEKIAYVM